MIKRCTWHKIYFGKVVIYGEKEPLSDTSFTDGMCSQCAAIEFLAIEVGRMERETI